MFNMNDFRSKGIDQAFLKGIGKYGKAIETVKAVAHQDLNKETTLDKSKGYNKENDFER